MDGAGFIERAVKTGDDMPDVLPISPHLGDSFIERLPLGGGMVDHHAKTCRECAVRVYRTFGLRTSVGRWVDIEKAVRSYRESLGLPPNFEIPDDK